MLLVKSAAFSIVAPSARSLSSRRNGTTSVRPTASSSPLVKALTRLPYIGAPDQRWLFEKSGREMDVRMQSHWLRNNGPALAKACEMGLGLARLADIYVGAALKSKRLLSFPQEHELPAQEIVLVHPAREHIPYRTQRVIQHLVQTMYDTLQRNVWSKADRPTRVGSMPPQSRIARWGKPSSAEGEMPAAPKAAASARASSLRFATTRAAFALADDLATFPSGLPSDVAMGAQVSSIRSQRRSSWPQKRESSCNS